MAAIPTDIEIEPAPERSRFNEIIVIALGTLVQTVAPWLHNVPQNPLQAMLTTPFRVAVFAVPAILIIGFILYAKSI